MAIATAEPDWKAIQERYLAGEDHSAIAEDYGVTANAIRCRAHRHHWKDQLLKLIGKNRKEVGEEIKNCVLVSCLREARMLQRTDPQLETLDVTSRSRERLLDTTSRILEWDAVPLANAKSIRCHDV